MEPNLNKVINSIIAKTIENLEKNGIKGVFVPSGKEAKALLATLLVPGESIGVGGSVTLDQIGAFDVIRDPKYNFIDRYEKGLSPEASYQRRKDCAMAEAFVCSSNAITETGLLYNVDGTGNRISAIAFGPKKVIVIAGYNKIVPTIEDAIVRVKKISAPANAVRLDKDSYCEKHGCCVCDHIDRCNMMFPPSGACQNTLCTSALITGRQPEGRMTVIIVGEELGY